MIKNKTIPIMIHFPDKVIKRIDRAIKSGFYASRNEAVRDAVRLKLDELEKGGDVVEKASEETVDRMFAEYINDNPHEKLKKLGYG